MWLLSAILLADFLTGFFHWLEDTYCVKGMGGVIGPQVCDPNLQHHEDQVAMLAGGFWHRNYTAFAVAGVPLLASLAMGWWWLAVVALVAGMGNEIHSWSHRKATGLPRLLQEMGIAITPQQHAKHHKKPHTECYCTVTNLLNPVLDRVLLWRGLEWAILKSTGVRPRRDQEASQDRR